MADLLMRMPIPYEPKKKNRFIFRFPTPLGIQEWFVASGSRPAITIEEVPIQFLNTETYVAGRFNWESIDVTFRDPIGPSAAQALMEWVRLHHESVTGRDGYSDFYKKDLTFNVLGPVGDVVSEWIIKGAFIKTMSQGDFDWSAPDAVELSITVAMDYCVLNY